ncbi:MAG: flagellar motor switch protein FliG [Proteobacteria bacterium]|nr:flagellar motor switch protein FliG [Pseudomonadota bacterium]
MAEDITSLTKAALILMSLGKDQAADVMKHLNEAEVKKLSRAFVSVQEVTRDVQRKVALEFHNMLQSVDRLVVDGKEFAKDVIGAAFGEKGNDGLVDYITGSKKEPLSVIFSDIPQNILEGFISSEHPQTVAFLLSKMPPEKAANTLAKLPDELQTDILVRISQLQQVKADVVDEVREVLRNQLKGVGVGAEEEIGGPKACAEILNFIDRSIESRIMMEIEEVQPELADGIRDLMFTFEDIGKIDDRSMQTILKETQREQLVLALKTASEGLKDLIFRNMSQRAADLLKDDMSNLGPTKVKDVEKAQKTIIDVVRRLEAEGKIQIAGGGADEVLV